MQHILRSHRSGRSYAAGLLRLSLAIVCCHLLIHQPLTPSICHERDVFLSSSCGFEYARRKLSMNISLKEGFQRPFLISVCDLKLFGVSFTVTVPVILSP